MAIFLLVKYLSIYSTSTASVGKQQLVFSLVNIYSVPSDGEFDLYKYSEELGVMIFYSIGYRQGSSTSSIVVGGYTYGRNTTQDKFSNILYEAE